MQKNIINIITDKIFLVDNLQSFSNNAFEFLYSFLPKERQNRVKKCYYDIDKKIKIVEYFVVKFALGIKDIINYKYGRNGKPYLKGYPYFNISHSEDVLVVGISNENIGIDVQHLIEYDDNLAKRILSKREYVEIQKSQDKSLELTKLWTKKESLIKYKGISIAQNLKTLLRRESLYKFQHFVQDGYVVCMCTKK